MKKGKSSRTAKWVTLMRAFANAGVSHVPDFRDETAIAFLDEKQRRQVADASRGAANGAKGFRIEFARSAADVLAFRTLAIDAAVRAAVEHGARQVVILGAGFDGRAWRMPELATCRIFEVDHPSTQLEKRADAQSLAAPVAPVTFVAVDFERDVLSEKLRAAGFDPSVKSCFIWEGVVMYLRESDIRATLQQIASLAAAGSTLIVNYHTSMRSLPFRLLLRWLGEPVRSKWSPDDAATALRGAGFDVIGDSGMLDWANRFSPSAHPRGGLLVARIVVGARR